MNPVSEPLIPVFRPHLGADVQAAVAQALQAGWLGMGELTKRFEDGLAQYLGLDDRQLVATNSCTAALHMAAVLADLGPGDEVICPSFTYVAGHQAMSATGANVVFCDIEERTLGVDPASVRAVLSPRTKAIMVTHFAGIPCDVEGVYRLAR
jgi:dTDP-4-amino-4,6-dideoxygalactose transaminase